MTSFWLHLGVLQQSMTRVVFSVKLAGVESKRWPRERVEQDSAHRVAGQNCSVASDKVIFLFLFENAILSHFAVCSSAVYSSRLNSPSESPIPTIKFSRHLSFRDHKTGLDFARSVPFAPSCPVAPWQWCGEV